MMVLVLGGSGSGKSAYAEETAVNLANSVPVAGNGMKKYYVATMRVCDGETCRKVEKHRQLRSTKGFCTIECPTAAHRALAQMEKGAATVLLECISNLTANEMFVGERVEPEEKVAETVLDSVRRLHRGTSHLVVVSNQVFGDGIVYEETTAAYIRAMGNINRGLAAMADRVEEVVAGIPVLVKQKGDNCLDLPKRLEGGRMGCGR